MLLLGKYKKYTDLFIKLYYTFSNINMYIQQISVFLWGLIKICSKGWLNACIYKFSSVLPLKV